MQVAQPPKRKDRSSVYIFLCYVHDSLHWTEATCRWSLTD